MKLKEVRLELKNDIAKLDKKIDIVHVQLMDFSDDVKQVTNDYEKPLLSKINWKSKLPRITSMF